MSNKNIPTRLGAAILAIIALTAGAFVWTYEKGQDPIALQTPRAIPRTTKTPIAQEAQPTITDATIIPGWKKYTAADNSFSIEYPSEWHLGKNEMYGSSSKGVAFYDTNNKLIAGTPWILTLQKDQQCLGDLEKEARTIPERITIISKKDTRVGKLIGTYIVIRGIKDPGGGYGFSNTYCIEKESSAFRIAFYEDNVHSLENEKLYQKILSTLKF
jgi:hypothetical protein